MPGPFFTLAAVSPTRQRGTRAVVAAHLAVLTYGVWAVLGAGGGLGRERAEVLLGSLLLTAGIVEGAVLLGWRLTQLPKSQALEFLLVTPLRPGHVLRAEALVGAARLALVTLAGLPLLLFLAGAGRLAAWDLLVLLVVPWTWGTLTGLGLTAWAYASDGVRRWGGRGLVALLLLYLVVGVLAGENLRLWVENLPEGVGPVVLHALRGFHEYNPFGLVRLWFTRDLAEVWPAALVVEAAAVAVVALLGWQCARRLKGHFTSAIIGRPSLPAPRGGRRSATGRCRGGPSAG